MTPNERRAAKALAGATILPGSFDKRFCRNIAAYPADHALSEKQAALLWKMVHRYRRQLPAEIVKLGQTMISS
jgi:hypothetical protein